MAVPRSFGQHILTTRKSYKLMIFWFAFFALPNLIMLESWAESKNNDLLFFIFLLWSPAFYMLADRLRSRLHVYENGLIYQSLFGTKTVAFKPNMQMYITRIQEKMYGINAARHVAVRLVQKDVSIKLPSSFLDMEEVIEILLDYQANTMLPAMIQVFNEGKTLNFGAIKLSNRMISVKDKKFPFSELSDIEVDNGVLRFYTHNNSGGLLQKGAAYIELSKIANFDVLNHLLSGTQAQNDVTVY